MAGRIPSNPHESGYSPTSDGRRIVNYSHVRPAGPSDQIVNKHRNEIFLLVCQLTPNKRLLSRRCSLNGRFTFADDRPSRPESQTRHEFLSLRAV